MTKVLQLRTGFGIFMLAFTALLTLPVIADRDEEYRQQRRKMMESSHPTLRYVQEKQNIPPILLATPYQSTFENSNMIETDNEVQNESSIAVNPLAPNYILGSAVDYRAGSSTWVYLSSDGGLTWRNINLGTPTNLNFTSSNDPSVAWDANGTGYVMYGGFDRNRTTGENGVFISRTTDKGLTWTRHIPVILHRGTQTPDSSFEDKYYVTVDCSQSSPYRNHLYTPWKRVIDRDSSTQIVISKSTDQGNTWSTPIRVSTVTPGNSLDTTFGQSFPIISTGPNGEVYCVWNFGPQRSIGFNSSMDGGVSWGTPRNIINYNWLGIARFTGGQYNHTLKGATRVESYPSLVCDTTQGPRRGWMYLTWAADRTPNIYFSRSTDKGVSWTAPVIVHSDTTNDQYWQWISIDPITGDLAVMYSDSRDDPSNILSRCYISYSNDGGTTWVDRPVGDAGSDITRNPFGTSQLRGTFAGDYSGCAFYNGKIYPSWVDMRATTATNVADNDAFTAIVNVRSPNPCSNFRVRADDVQNTILQLSWNTPTQKALGQPLATNEFMYGLYRDNIFLRTIPSTDTAYTDTGLTAFKEYTYKLVTILLASPDTSAPRIESGFAGGSQFPQSPVLERVTNLDDGTARITLLTPSLRADSLTALSSLAAIELYRDSVFARSYIVSQSDTSKRISITDTMSNGYYTYTLRARDAAGNRSTHSNQILQYTGTLTPYNESFSSPRKPYLHRGSFGIATDFFGSSPSSLNTSPGRNYSNFSRDTITLFPVKSMAGIVDVQFVHACFALPRDTSSVEYSVDSMKTWQRLQWYDSTKFSPWSDGITQSNDFKPETFRIPTPIGSDMTLRFRFSSNINGASRGWYIDDLQFFSPLTSVDDKNSLHSTVLVYPNPAQSYIRIAYLANQSVDNLIVANTLGIPQQVSIESIDTSGATVNVSSLPSGVYQVLIRSTSVYHQASFIITR